MKKKLLLVVIVFLAGWACKPATSPPAENKPPNTTLSNIPVQNDTLFPVVQITWDGGDEDGYITGCQYSYTTYHLTKGDSFHLDWTYTEDEIFNIIFESSDVMNRQVLKVRAIDNKGTVDPTPATLTIYTPQTILPVTTILFPNNKDDFFYLDKPTDWWKGVPLRFTAYDQDGEVEEYAFSIDGSDWMWTQDTSQILTPDMFSQPLQGKHTIRVTARDNTNLFDPQGYEIEIEFVKPTFNKQLLIIDETNESSFPATVKATDADVDSFYNALFHPDTTWDLIADGFPSKKILGRYKQVLWHADSPASTGPHQLPLYKAQMADYMNVGGSFIATGWQLISSFAYGSNLDNTVFEQGTFVHDYLHINRAKESGYIPGDFLGAAGMNGFSTVNINPDLIPYFPYQGKMNLINTIEERGGFTEGIYSYFGASDENFIGHICGIRYIGTDFNVIVIGFPMFFLMPDDAATMADELLKGIQQKF